MSVDSLSPRGVSRPKKHPILYILSIHVKSPLPRPPREKNVAGAFNNQQSETRNQKSSEDAVAPQHGLG